MSPSSTSASTLPLFPLHTVLFPGGLLSLKVFEPRYLDLMSTCLREGRQFGVVCLREGSEVLEQPPGQSIQLAQPSPRFERIGVRAELLEVDAVQANILQVRCRGLQRFELGPCQQAADGLWCAETQAWEADEEVLPSADLVDTARALARAIAALKQQGSEPFLKPFHFESAGWVANRWCEILPVPARAKQHLMALQDPLMRLQLVADFLRDKGVVR